MAAPSGNQRRYPREILRRVAVIKAAQRVGIPLAAIQEALASLPEKRTPTAEDWGALSARWRGALDERINRLIKLRRRAHELHRLRAACRSIRARSITRRRSLINRLMRSSSAPRQRADNARPVLGRRRALLGSESERLLDRGERDADALRGLDHRDAAQDLARIAPLVAARAAGLIRPRLS